MANDPRYNKPSWTGRIGCLCDQLKMRTKALTTEGSIRCARIIGLGDGTVLEMPLTIRDIAGGVPILAAKLQEIVRTLAAFFAKPEFKIVDDWADQKS